MRIPDPEHFKRVKEMMERNRVDDATRDRLRQQGFATAYNVLFDGHAGYFMKWSDGQFISEVDRQTGLPVFTIGDVVSEAADIWRCGFGEGTKHYIQQFGPPWNSHLNFINELADIETYFTKRSRVETPICLSMGEPPHPGPEPGLTIQLTDGPTLRKVFNGPHIRLTSERLYCGILRWYPGGSSTGKPGDDLLVERKGTPASPRAKSGTTDVFLRFYSLAQKISFLWGPPGSRLCFFRFDEVVDLRRPGQPETIYAALDLCLADWIPSYVPGLTKERWQK